MADVEFTEREKRLFKRNGFLVCEDLLDPDLVERASDAVWDGIPYERHDHEALVETIDDSDAVLAWDLLDVQDDTFHLYIHVPPGQPAGGLIALAQKYALIIDTPLKFTDQGGLRTTIVGTHEMLRQALSETPDGVKFAVEQAGQYSPDREDILSILTERQHEVFETAIQEGYYEIPREATHEDIANSLGCAPSTVDEHLRKAESRVLSALMR
jgi:hypothetical protein